MGRDTILVVDDDRAVLALLGTALPEYGLAVLTAAGGEEAVEVYRRHREAVALVLLDVRMPGLDGPATLAALRQVDPLVRCCFMSGNTGEYAWDDLTALGAVCVFAKPFGGVAGLAAELGEIVRRGPEPATAVGDGNAGGGHG